MIAGQITEFPLRRGWVLRLTESAADGTGLDPSSEQGCGVGRKPARSEGSSLRYGLMIGCLSEIYHRLTETRQASSGESSTGKERKQECARN